MGNICVFILSSIIVFFSCRRDSTPQQLKTLLNLQYGTHARNTLDITLPAGRTSATPVVILVHGGSWIAGSKEDMSSLRMHMAARGFAAASINYRYVSATVHSRDIMNDIGNAVSYIASNAPAWRVSTGFGLVGFSAGGHLGLLYAHAHNTGNIKAVTSLVGPTDFKDTAFRQYIESINPEGIMYLTGQYSSADKGELQAASPLYHVKDIPTQLIYGKLDSTVPYTQGERMKDTLQAKGYSHEFILFKDAGHNVAGDAYQHADSINNAIARWMKSYVH